MNCLTSNKYKAVHRGPIAARQLKRAGYDVTNVSGGMMAWDRAGLPVERR